MELNDILSLEDDLDIDTATGTEYAQPEVRTGFEPIPDAIYEGKLMSSEFDKDRATGQLKTPRTPVLLVSVAITTPGTFANRRISFQRVYSKPYNRRGQQVSGLMDLLYAINAYDVPTEAKEKFLAVNQAVTSATPIKFKTVTRAFDKKYFEDKGGQHLVKGTDEYKALQKASTVTGFNRFTATGDGRLVTKGPSGQEIEGRCEISTWVPSTVS